MKATVKCKWKRKRFREKVFFSVSRFAHKFYEEIRELGKSRRCNKRMKGKVE